MQIAGLLEASQTPSDADLAMGHDFLALELGALQSEGLVAHTVDHTATESLVASTATYALDADCIDVIIGVTGFCGTVQSGTGTEMHVRAITRHEYNNITNKDAEGTPSHCYIDRGLSLSLTFWPVPSAALTFRYEKVRLMRDSSDGSKTPDVQRRRQKALVWCMAHDLAMAKSMGLDRVQYLRKEADRLKAIAHNDDVERGHGQFYLERRRIY